MSAILSRATDARYLYVFLDEADDFQLFAHRLEVLYAHDDVPNEAVNLGPPLS